MICVRYEPDEVQHECDRLLVELYPLTKVRKGADFRRNIPRYIVVFL